MNAKYSKPKENGGRLIRTLVKSWGTRRHFRKGVVVAFSGGADSTALLTLLAKYGRRVVPREAIRAIHVNHGWRESAKTDEEFAKDFCRELNVPLEVAHSSRGKPEQGESWESTGRNLRYDVFYKNLPRGHSLTTAHQADDLAETMLWRLFTGAAQTHGAGILEHAQAIWRPLIAVRKSDLVQFLLEEGISPITDPTNTDTRFLRNRIRLKILPEIEAAFPRAVAHLVDSARRVHLKRGKPSLQTAIFAATGFPLRRAQVLAIQNAISLQGAQRESQISLPGGWKIKKSGEDWLLTRSQV